VGKKHPCVLLKRLRMGPFTELSTRLKVVRHAVKPRQSDVQMSSTSRFPTFRHAKSESYFHRNELLGHEVVGH
jgi:hypothetical protein